MNIMLNVEILNPSLDIRIAIRDAIKLSKQLNIPVRIDSGIIVTPSDTLPSVLSRYKNRV
jgi:hypothetical protein